MSNVMPSEPDECCIIVAVFFPVIPVGIAIARKRTSKKIVAGKRLVDLSIVLMTVGVGFMTAPSCRHYVFISEAGVWPAASPFEVALRHRTLWPEALQL